MRRSVFLYECQALIETLKSQGFKENIHPKIKNYVEKTILYRVTLEKNIEDRTIQCELCLNVHTLTRQNTFEMRIESSTHESIISMAKLADLHHMTVPYSESLGQSPRGQVRKALHREISIYLKLLPEIQNSLDGVSWQSCYYGSQDF